MKLTKEVKGITLVALVITIIVLLILAGVALATLTGNTSIIDNANNAVQRYNESSKSDQNVLDGVENLFAKYMGGAGNPPANSEINSETDSWVTPEEVEEQYGTLVNPVNDVIKQGLFIYELHGPDGGAERGTATVKRINWEYFADDNCVVDITDYPEDEDNPASTKIIITVKSLSKTTEIENTLKKLVIPYEVIKNDVTYDVRSIDADLLWSGGFYSDYNTDVNFVTPENADFATPTLAYGSNFDVQQGDQSNTSYLIIPKSVTSIGRLFLLQRNQILFAADCGVTTIPKVAFASTNYFGYNEWDNLNVVSLPAGLTSIEQNAFYYTDYLTDVNFPGTRAEWNAITKGTGNGNLTSAIHCSDD